ncbi:MAG TPA: DUF1326 domain-containing protein [Actinomycetota bacterium]|nr:DUF1326 domain-containing protein [Actinomycetota bacterium]
MSIHIDNVYYLEGTVVDVYRGAPFWYRAGDLAGESTSVTTWLIDKGEVAGIGVSDTAVITVTSRTGASDAGQRLILVDEDAAPEVVRWVVDAFQGRLGGPLAELAELAGTDVGFYQVPINYRLDEKRSFISVPSMLKVQAAGRRIPESHPAGSAAPWRRCWIGEGSGVEVSVPAHGLDLVLPQTRAVRGGFRFAS